MKSQYEINGGTYTEKDGIFYPDITPPEPEPRPIGIWGMRHEEYLKEHRYLTYLNLLTTGKLDTVRNAIKTRIGKFTKAEIAELVTSMSATR